MDSKRRAVLAAVLAALAVPATATAHRRPDPTATALQAAMRYWHAKPCGGRIPVIRERALPTSAYASGAGQPVLESGEGTASAWWEPGTCTIHLNAAVWTVEAVRQNYQQFCDTITHEVGHMPPLDHPDAGQSDPRSIEYPVLSMENYNAVPECRPRP